MAINMRRKSLLSIADLTLEEVNQIFDLSRRLKQERLAGMSHRHILKDKKIALIFEKPSTRTRVSFEVGAYELGMYPLYLSSRDLQLGRGETISDTIKVLERYVDGVMARVFEHEKLVQMRDNSNIPIINGLSDLLHPCQVLADLFTILEKKGTFKGKRMVYIGDGSNNMAHSLLIGSGKVGLNITIISPSGFKPNAEILELAKDLAKKHSSSIEITDDIEAVKGADIVYTDVWASMGQEEEAEKRKERFMKYQVNSDLMKKAADDAIFMHCLPAHRGEEVTDEVADSPQSVIFDEAENRLHVQKAIMAFLMAF